MPLHKDLTGTDLHVSRVVGTDRNLIIIDSNLAIDSEVSVDDLDVGIFTRDAGTTTVTLVNSGDTVDLDGTLNVNIIREHTLDNGVDIDGVDILDGSVYATDGDFAGTVHADTIDEYTLDNGIDIETVHIENGDVTAESLVATDGYVYFDELSGNDYIKFTPANRKIEAYSEGNKILDIGYTARETLVGYLAGGGQSGDYPTMVGYYAGRFNTGDYAVVSGYLSGYTNTGDNVVMSGYQAGQYNTGNLTSVYGNASGQYNTGNFSTCLSAYSGRYNCGANSVFVGYVTGQYNDGSFNTIVGYDAYSNFNEDSGSAKTFDNTDVSDQNITITTHGFGATGTYKNLKFTQGTGTIGGMTSGTVYKFKIIDANTIQSFGFTISSPTGTGHTLTPQYVYTNVTAIGYDAEPSASNQIVLGDTNVTEVKSAGVGNFGGAKLGDGGTTDYLQVSADGTVTLYGDARYDDFIQVPVGAVSAVGASAASYVARGINGAWEYTDNLQRQTSTTVFLRDNMDRSVAPTLRIFWETPTTSATCKWSLEYIYRKANEDMSTTTVTTVPVDGTSSATANGQIYTDFSLATPDSDDTILVMRLTRLGGDAGDTCNASVYTHGGIVMNTANKL